MNAENDETRTREPEQGPQRIPVQGEAEAPAEETVVEIDAEELAALRAKAEECVALEDRLKRVAADYANTQKRIEREARTRIDYALQDFLLEILAVTDSLERALGAAEQSKDLASFVEGIRLVDKQFHDILARHGVAPIPAAKGEPFDPDLHEVMGVIPTDELPEHAVIEEFERGFRLKGRVIRPTRVLVAGSPKGDEAEQKEAEEPGESGA